MGYSKHASFADTVDSTRHSIGSIATPSTTDFALRFAATTDDVHEFRWCSWLLRNGRHCVLMFLKFPSIISQLYIWRVRLVRHLPWQHLQMGSLHVQCQVRVGWGSDFSGGGFILFRLYVMPGSIQRGAFFLTVEVQKEAVPVMSRSLRVALSSHRTESS